MEMGHYGPADHGKVVLLNSIPPGAEVTVLVLPRSGRYHRKVLLGDAYMLGCRGAMSLDCEPLHTTRHAAKRAGFTPCMKAGCFKGVVT